MEFADSRGGLSWFELKFRGKKKAPECKLGAWIQKMVEDYPRNSNGISKLKIPQDRHPRNYGKAEK